MISVVIPTYKRPKDLKRLLKSIISQTVKPSEIIIVDDCSNMDFQYKKILNDIDKSKIEIRFFSNKKNMGAPFTRNKGIQKAKNKWIALVDDDDYWLKNKLSKQREIMIKYPQYDLISSWSYIKSGKNLDIYKVPKIFLENPKRYILETNFIPSPTIVVKKEALYKVNLYDLDLPSCQDWDLWTRFIIKGFKIFIINEPLTIYTKDNINSIGLSKNAKKGYRIFLKKHFFSILKYTSINNWIRKIYLFLSTFKRN